MDFRTIIYQKDGPISTITLNRPEKLNAISVAMFEELTQALADIEQAQETRVVIFKGAGRCFSAGYDFAEAADWHIEEDPTQMSKRFKKLRRWYDWIWESDKAFIAQVHSYCIAGGGHLASMCDITIAADDALFGYPAVREVAAPPTLWAYLVGMKKAKELLFTGNLMDAQEALLFGLVNRVVPRDRLEEETRKLAEDIAKAPPATVTLNKWAINRAFEMMGLRVAEQFMDDLNAMSHRSAGGDEFFQIVKKKGLKAAIEWRDRPFKRAES